MPLRARRTRAAPALRDKSAGAEARDAGNKHRGAKPSRVNAPWLGSPLTIISTTRGMQSYRAITPPRQNAQKLTALRGPDESMSDVILRLVEVEARGA